MVNKRRFLKKVKYRNLSNFVFINKNPFGFLQNYPSMIKARNKKKFLSTLYTIKHYVIKDMSLLCHKEITKHINILFKIFKNC